ncbi:hypothetical protein PEPTYR26121_00962 [Peptoniphilus tyrrelliae]|nr:hypothetical protein PEPTYR26121_00962 [Peptoniphilus tyrrelliae]
MKRRFTLLIAMVMLLTAMATNVFAYNSESIEHEKMYSVSSDSIEYEDLMELKEDVKAINNDYDLEEELIFETEVGEIINKYNNNKIDFREKATSLNYNDREEVIAEILKIYDLSSTDEKLKLDIYVRGALETLITENPTRQTMNLEKAFNSIYENQYNEKDNLSLRASNQDHFDYLDAIWYAHNYYENYNSNYPDLSGPIGGDCANFVSQILHYGGYRTDNKWYIKRKNYKYNNPKDITELNYSWDLADPSPWISAKYFNNYWSNIVKTETIDDDDFVNKNMFNKLNFFKGDTVQLLRKKYFSYYGYHTMYITDYTNNSKNNRDFAMTYHTRNRIDKPLVDVVEAFMNGGGSYKVKFFKTR